MADNWADEFIEADAPSWADEFTGDTIEEVEDPNKSFTQGSIGEGVTEAVMNLGSSMVAKPVSEVMGMSAVAQDAITGAESDPMAYKEEIQKNLTYAPKSEIGQAITESPYNPVNMIGNAMGSVADFVSGFGEDEAANSPLGMLSNAMREVTLQAPALIGGKMSTKGRLQKKQQALDFKKGNNKLIDAARNEAQSHGFITPAEGGIKAQISGVAKTNQSISQKNQATATGIIKKEIGVPAGEAMSGGVLATLRERHYNAYKDVVQESIGKVGEKLNTTPEFKAQMAGHLSSIEAMLKEYPKTNKSLRAARDLFKEQLTKTDHSPPVMMESIKQLRSEAKLLYNKTNAKPSDIATASAKLSIANSLEGLFDYHLSSVGKSGTVAKFRSARMRLAQIHTIESALNKQTGMIDIKTLKNLSKKQKMSGGLKTVADFGEAFESASMSLKGAPQLIGLFDTVVAGTSFAAGHPGWSFLELSGRLGIPALGKTGVFQKKTPAYQASSSPSKALMKAGMIAPSSDNAIEARRR